jgi:hypothetical protein
MAYLEGRADLVRKMAPHTITPPCKLRLRPLLPKTLFGAEAMERCATANPNPDPDPNPNPNPEPEPQPEPQPQPRAAAAGDAKPLTELSSAELNERIRSSLLLDMADALKCGVDRLRVLRRVEP